MIHMLWDLFEKEDNHFMWESYDFVYHSEDGRMKSLQRRINEAVRGLREPEEVAKRFGELS
jgi:hypothetical protein